MASQKPSESVYIVTGGAGFIGSNLVATLLRNEPNAMIYVVDDFRTGSYANIVEACERNGVGPFRGSVLSDSVSDLNWQPALLGLQPKAVFHLAAITDTLEFDEKKMISENTEPFTDILEACVECNVPLVYASSAATYGSPKVADDRVPFPLDAAGMPNNVYGFSKWLMDVEVFRFFEQRLSANESLPHVVGLRYFNVFGPGESRKGKMASMVLHLTNQILDGQRPKLFKVGEHERDQVFVDDVVNCTIAGANPNAKPGVYNLGSGQTTSFNDIVDAINEALGMNVAAEYFDMPEKMVSTYQHYTCADMSETKNGLNWVPAWSPIDAMIRYARQIASERTSSSSVTSTHG
ncbi:MAG: NAD-dependent epimerase/dehydratase family protein [Phycisphaerales bacterium]|nr:NAD-dependent epimerase/dehydratase family protein [Phycisphaerales bacterium]